MSKPDSMICSSRYWRESRPFAQVSIATEMGARPMKRVIQDQIKRPLADNLLFGDLAEGGEVRVDAPGVDDSGEPGDKLVLEVSAKADEPKALPAATE